MFRFFFILIITLLASLSPDFVFAEGCDITEELPSNSELTSSIDQCITARSWKWETANSITAFVCPQGDVFWQNNKVINWGTIAYSVSVNLAFNKADKDIKKYMQELQKTREPDPTKWIENINACQKKISNIYYGICSFRTLTIRINENPAKQYILDTTAYPQELCNALAARKIQWWYNLGTIMMSDGISKNKKNSTDKWATEVKWAYAKLLADWHTYQKILARAAGKMTGYNKQVVK